jgi:thymidylate kinase
MNHIILEGPDGAGKTTLAQELVRVFNLEYHHEGPPPLDRYPIHHYSELITSRRRPTVFDRLHLGETVYGPLLRGSSRISRKELNILDRLTPSPTIICIPDLDTCLENCSKKEELIKDESQLKSAYDAWLQIVATSGVRYLTFDYERDDIAEVYVGLLKALYAAS